MFAPAPLLLPSFSPLRVLTLLQAAADTAAPRFVVEHGWLDTTASVAQSLVSVLVMVMLVMGVLLLYALRRSIDELSKLIRSAYDPLKAAIGEAREVTGEVRTLVRGLHTPLTAAGATIEEATEKVRIVMDVAEGRLARLDALVDIAQGEAEEVVVKAASLMRGVQAGSRAVGATFGLADGRHAPRHDEDGDEVGEADDEDEASDDVYEVAPARPRRRGRHRPQAKQMDVEDEGPTHEAPRIRRRDASHL